MQVNQADSDKKLTQVICMLLQKVRGNSAIRVENKNLGDGKRNHIRTPFLMDLVSFMFTFQTST